MQIYCDKLKEKEVLLLKNKLYIKLSLIVIIFVAIILAIFIPIYNSYKFEQSGKKELIDYLTNIPEKEKRQEEINNALEKGWITESDLK